MEKYIEFVDGSIYRRGIIIKLSEYVNVRRDSECYTSLFCFNEDVVEYVKNNISPKTKQPSIEGFIGECSASYLWIDIDIEGDIKLATQKMIDVVNIITARYGLTEESIVIYFSGNKGYHVGIPTKSFGADEISSDILPATFKTMAAVITDGVVGVDSKIYNTSRIFRSPFSKHPKTGLYKVPVSYEQLLNGNIDAMLDASRQCMSTRTCGFDPQFSQKLKTLFDDSYAATKDNVDIYTDEDGYDAAITLSTNSSIFRLPNHGERNDIMYKMAYRLFATKGLKVNEISDIMKFVFEVTNEYSIKKGWPRYSELEYKMSINSAYRRTRLKPVQAIGARSFASMTALMFKKIMESKYIPTLYDEITADLKGGWRLGDLYTIIGKGGTMKSFLLQEEAIRSACILKQHALFINLEMSDVTFFDRVWTGLCGISFTDMIKHGSINERNIMEAQDMATEQVGKYLHVFSGVDLEPEEIEKIIKQKEDETKEKMSFVGIDSANGMKMYGDSEAITAMKLSKYLKEAAKNTNTALMLINHARNDCPKALRDCSQYVRGGSKFVDNCDAFISLSAIVDKERSNYDKNPPDVIYKQGYSYLRFINKRGSGNTINKIIALSQSGRIVDHDVDPSTVEVTENGFSAFPFKM